MKILYTLLLLSLGVSCSLAQYTSTTVSADVDATAFAQQSQALQDIDVNFCDHYGDKSIVYPIYLGKPYDICLNIYNGSTSEATINLDFVDGMLTNDQRKNKACGLSDDKDSFGMYVTGYNSVITLSGNTSKKIHAILLYPTQMQSLLTWSHIDGCLVYSVSHPSLSGQHIGFGVVVRKAKFIDVYIKTRSKFILRPCVLLLFPILLILGVVYKKRKSKPLS